MTGRLAAFAPRRVLEHDLLGEGPVVSEDATTLFVDLEGFTSLTDRLGRFGSRGTEQLSRVLRDFFGQVTNAVTELGGDLVAYSGDALTLVYDGATGPTLEAARRSAEEIRRLAAQASGADTLAGPVRLRSRIGIARGGVTTAVARSSRRCLPVNLGPGIDLAVAAEASAEADEVVVDPRGFEPAAASAVDAPGAGTAREEAAHSPDRPTPKPAGTAGLAGLVSPLMLDRLASGGSLESHRRISAAFARFPPVAPAGLGAFLAEVSTLLELVDDWEGELVQVSGGDKGVVAMVVFGAPLAHGDDANRAVEAMLETRSRVADIAAGVATGPVFAALLGSRTRLVPTHSGLAVSTAARLMEKASAGQLLVDGETWAAASGRLRRTGRPSALRVKGRQDEVEVHVVGGRRRPRPLAVTAARPPLAGRGPEVAALERLLDDATGGRGGVLTLEGDPGIGKTRLVQEVVDRARTRGFLVAASDVLDHPRGRPQELWRDLVGSLLGVPTRAGAGQLGAALAACLPEAGAQIGRLGALLGVRVGVPVPAPARGSGEVLDVELAEGLLVSLLDTLSRDRPLLIAIDNADHLDDSSARTVAVLARSLTASRACLVTTSATGGPPAGRPSASTGRLPLAELDRKEVALVAADAWRQAGGGTPPPWLAEAAHLRAGGNPLFVRSVAWELRSSWRPGSPPPALDDSADRRLGALLSEGIDRLDAGSRHLLDVLAVSGRPCARTVVAAVCGDRLDAEALAGALASLAAGHLVEVELVGDDERLRLVHDQLRQTVYGSMSHAERGRLHRRFVTSLAELGADPLDVAGHVRHLDDAGLRRRWFPLAAAAARRSWNLSDAATYLELVVPLLAGRARAEAEVELLEVLLVAGRADEVLKEAGGAVAPVPAAAAPAPERLLAARRLHVVAEAAASCGDYGPAETAAAEAMRLLDTLDEARYQRSAELLVLARSERGATREAVATARGLVARATPGDPTAWTTAHAALGAALLLSGRPAEAAAEYEQALAGARETGDAVRQVHVLSDLAGCAFETGRYADCAGLLTDARAVADRIGYRRHLAFNLSNEAQLRAGLEDPYAAACAAVAVRRSLDLGDLACAANNLHTWLTAVPSLAGDATRWRRLADIDNLLDRPLLATRDRVHAALAAARAGRRKQALDDAALAAAVAGDLGQAPLLRRATLARLVAAYPAAGRGSAAAQAAVVTSLDELVAAPDADPVDRAEVGLERWRLTRSSHDHRSAVRLATEAFAAQPSAAVRAWLRELSAPEPEPPPPSLPPPAGISGVRTTRAQLDDAFSRVESALRARARAQRSE